MDPATEFVIGVDVGTLSTRAGIFDLKGVMLGSANFPISIDHPKPDFAEQSSDEIWEKTGMAIREALRQAQIVRQDVVGLSFDATCSLVCLDKKYRPADGLSDSRSVPKYPRLDGSSCHRGGRIRLIRRSIESSGIVGGQISPEQQPPKLKWIKKHLPRTWKLAGKFMDLADFMVFKATGEDKRSLCTSVCKWTYLGHKKENGSWDYTFFERIGLSDLFENEKVPEYAHPIGHLAGRLTENSAQQLGLSPGIAVGVGIIDAHAGGIGVLGNCARKASKDQSTWDKALALIGGTSSCHMAVSSGPRFIRGIWGPYYGAMIPNMWLNEGGQSATGSLIDYVIKNNSSYDEIESCAQKAHMDIYQFLNREIKKTPGPERTKDFPCSPLSLRKPIPQSRCPCQRHGPGMTLNQSILEVAKNYYATVQAIAYGTRTSSKP